MDGAACAHFVVIPFQFKILAKFLKQIGILTKVEHIVKDSASFDVQSSKASLAILPFPIKPINHLDSPNRLALKKLIEERYKVAFSGVHVRSLQSSFKKSTLKDSLEIIKKML